MYHARSNLPCSRYTNEIYAQARSGQAKRATLLVIIITRSEARFARLLLDCELSYCFHWVIVVVGGRVHEWCKKGSGIL